MADAAGDRSNRTIFGIKIGNLKSRSACVGELERRSQLVRNNVKAGLPPPSPQTSIDINAFVQSYSSSCGSEIDMERSFSDSLVLTDGAVADGRHESAKELREQVKHLASLNSLLSEQLNACEGQLEMYKERLMEVQRQHPVAAERGIKTAGGSVMSHGVSEMSSAGRTVDSMAPILVNMEELRRLLEASNVAIMPAATLSLHKTLGTGCFGETVLGKFDGIVCAVKKLFVDKINVEQQFVREVEALQMVRHPHVLSLWGVVLEPDACWLVTEYLPGGTLNDAIRRSCTLNSKPLSTRMQILWDVASGMAAMERNGILHRDLKPSNVLLDVNLRAKVADMGLARIVNNDHVVLTPETGTYIYMAPEVMNGESYGTAADVWSWACLAVEVLSFEYPYQRRLLTPLQIAKEVMQLKIRPDLPEGLGVRMKELLQRCLAFVPSERPSFKEITEEMEIVCGEQKAKECVENGLRKSSSWKNIFSRDSSGSSGKPGRLSSSPSPVHFDI